MRVMNAATILCGIYGVSINSMLMILEDWLEKSHVTTLLAMPFTANHTWQFVSNIAMHSLLSPPQPFLFHSRSIHSLSPITSVHIFFTTSY